MSNTEFQINTYTTSGQAWSAITGLSDGGFVVTWRSAFQDGSGNGVFGQRYDSSGNTAGSEFQINTYTNDDQHATSVASLNDGGFVVTWMSDGQDGSGWGVFGQRYDSSGNTEGSEFQINTYTNDRQSGPSITGLSDGGFVVTWRSNGQDGGGSGVFGQRFDANGVMVERISSTAPTIDTFMGDNVLTYAEQSSFVLSGIAEAGSTVALEYSGPFGVSGTLPVTVTDGSGVWSLNWQSVGSPPVYDFFS